MNAPAEKMTADLPKVRPASLAWGDALAATASISQNPDRLLPHLIEQLAVTNCHAPALLSDTESFSFAELARRMDQYAVWAGARGLKHGDRVAIMMSNRPAYVALWLGLSKIGMVCALINTSLNGRSLEHCLKLAAPRHVIAEQPFVTTCEAALGTGSDVRVWDHDGLDLRDSALSSPKTAITIDDTALLIYTSGTTGLPKAARVSHRRLLNWALWFKGLLGNTAADRMYDCLPLYHSVGGVVAVAATLVAGGSTVIAPKFSARQFWDDIRRWDCTQFQYIGELCRYLLTSPDTGSVPNHRLRLACGNGLRADIWTGFQQRFAIPQIIEFYAATEGSFSLFNVEGKPGAIGHVPAYLRHRFPTAIVKFDPGTGQPVRGADGFCVRVEAGEAGEALGRISAGDGAGRFEGYTDQIESERKVLRGVFAAGDAWFRTGDLMRFDTAGFYYFVDRIGDTFRWKGENVSTLEVANVAATAPGVRDAVIYGIDVPGVDGKAGMAMLKVDSDFDLAAFRLHTASQLPAFAVPLFLRFGKDISTTETFKHMKQALIGDGFDPVATSDQIFVWLGERGSYVALDGELHRKIISGQIHF